MQITTHVQLAEDDEFTLDPDEAAKKVLAALGGKVSADTSTLTVQQPATTGSAGVNPAAPAKEE